VEVEEDDGEGHFVGLTEAADVLEDVVAVALYSLQKRDQDYDWDSSESGKGRTQGCLEKMDTEADGEAEDGAALLGAGLGGARTGCGRAACTSRVSRVPLQREALRCWPDIPAGHVSESRHREREEGAVAVHAQPLIAGFSQSSLNFAFVDIAGGRLAGLD
jgi:hypothetical protein